MEVLKAVEVSRLVRGPGRLEAFNLAVSEEDVLAVIGPLGETARALVRSMSGRLKLTSGEIELDKHPLPKNPRREICCHENFNLPLRNAGVTENLIHALRTSPMNTDEKVERVLTLVRMLDLAPVAEKKPEELDAREYTLAALAFAAATPCKVYAFINPLGGLEPWVRRRVQSRVKKLMNWLDGPVLFTTDDPREALNLSNRIVFLQDGRVRQTGTPGELLYYPRDTQIAGFFSDYELNAFVGRVVRDTPYDVVETSLFSVPVTPEMKEMLHDYRGQEVLVGVRSESITDRIFEAGGRERVVFSGTVELIEHWGADTIAHLDAGVGRQIPVFVGNVLSLDLGSELRVGFSAEDIIFFDPVGQFSLDYRERYYHGGK